MLCHEGLCPAYALEIDLFSRERMVATERELWEEREGVKDLLGSNA